MALVIVPAALGNEDDGPAGRLVEGVVPAGGDDGIGRGEDRGRGEQSTHRPSFGQLVAHESEARAFAARELAEQPAEARLSLGGAAAQAEDERPLGRRAEHPPGGLARENRGVQEDRWHERLGNAKRAQGLGWRLAPKDPLVTGLDHGPHSRVEVVVGTDPARHEPGPRPLEEGEEIPHHPAGEHVHEQQPRRGQAREESR